MDSRFSSLLTISIPRTKDGTRSLYGLTNHALAQIRELWQYAGEDELPPDSFLQAQVEALRILHIEVPLSAKRQFQLFCSEHFPGLTDILDWSLPISSGLSSLCASSSPIVTNFKPKAPRSALVASGRRYVLVPYVPKVLFYELLDSVRGYLLDGDLLFYRLYLGLRFFGGRKLVHEFR